MSKSKTYLAVIAGAFAVMAASGAHAQAAPASAAASTYKPTLEDWVAVNDAVVMRTSWVVHKLAEDDRVLVIQATQGG